ncbi:PAS domain S-box protein [Salinigranum sp. GCM10025319]|uniref:hybrid sensor histidine kinase/response regulator n=1 Tax=Salinigranum sp. GCM10025319 TaxID=3252687 RepID=UPI00360CF585
MNNGSIRVLHVDDEPNLLELVSTLLRREAAEITVVSESDPTAALESLTHEPVDCIVSDYDMPEMNGLEFLSTIRETYPTIPFVLYTGKGSEEIASEAISAGVTDYMQKNGGLEQYAVLANRIKNAVTQYHANLELEETRERFQTLVEDATDAILTVSADGTIQYATPMTEQVFGREPAELVGTDIFDSVTPDARSRLRDDLADLQAHPGGRRTFEFRHQVSDGGERWIEARARNLLGNSVIDGIVLYAQDITDRKNREEELKQYRDRLEGAMLVGDLAWWEMDVPTGSVAFNSGKAKMLGYDPGHFSHFEDFTELLHPADHDRAMQAMWDHFEGTAERYDVRYRIKAADGGYHWFHDIGGITERADDGAPLTVTGVVVDISTHEARKELIEDEQNRFRAVFEQAFDAMIIADDQGTYVDANPAACELFGTTRDELVGRSAAEFAVEEYDVEDAWSSFLETNGERGTFPLQRPSGEVRLTEYSATRNIVPGEHLSILRDVTSRVETETELTHQNERLDMFTRIVSHDLKTPLSVLEGSLTLAEETGDPEHFERCRRTIDRMRVLIDELYGLAQAGRTIADHEPVALPDVIQDAWETVVSDDVQLRIETEQTIMGDPGRLQQLLVNLFQNAADEAETTTITVGSLDDGFFVEDDGPGIAESARGTVFETGHSTKSEGSGFGLTIVKEIARAHEWELDVTDGRNGGARFEVSNVTMVER